MLIFLFWHIFCGTLAGNNLSVTHVHDIKSPVEYMYSFLLKDSYLWQTPLRGSETFNQRDGSFSYIVLSGSGLCSEPMQGLGRLNK